MESNGVSVLNVTLVLGVVIVGCVLQVNGYVVRLNLDTDDSNIKLKSGSMNQAATDITLVRTSSKNDQQDQQSVKLSSDTVSLVKETTSDRIWAPQTRRQSHQRTVHHFAVYGICHHWEGRRRFWLALKSVLCDIRGRFIVNLIRDLCKQRGGQLVNWVSELFDVDDDGYISHYEKSMYD